MWVRNPIACSCSLVLGSTQPEYFESQTMLGPSSQNACGPRKLMIMGKATLSQPTLLTMARGGRSSCCTTCDVHLESKMASAMKPSSYGTKSYGHCNKSSGVNLVHNQRNQYAQDPTNVISTKIGLPNQTYICYHATKTCGCELPNGRTFSQR